MKIEEKIKLLNATGAAATYELLAEECTELAHAALKMGRYIRGENPTPETYEQIRASLREEVADVYLILDVLDIKANDVSIAAAMQQKCKRWIERLEEKGN